jgi:hypothetical protein
MEIEILSISFIIGTIADIIRFTFQMLTTLPKAVIQAFLARLKNLFPQG